MTSARKYGSSTMKAIVSYYQRFILVGLIGSCLAGIWGCASVPDEAVELSYKVGEDIEQLHAGYRKTVVFAFEQMRQTGLTVIDKQWTPIYLKTFIKEGLLVEFAQDNNIEAVEYWARTAINDIDKKRQEFLVSLKQKEMSLIANIDEAFGRTIRANAAVTAHLNSVLKVQKFQDSIFDSLGLKDLRDKINNGLVDASDFAAEKTKEIEDIAEKLEAS